ncbi:MAG: CinA domain protein [Gammaproteobacteria bacterium]|jgi:nicotinamide-nucleotide amidase|nr:CinA domain protein [Gammaproteobacteria bacterium]
MTHLPSDQILESLSTQLGELLLAKGLKLATAESCTGGGIAQIITEIPGSSAWFDRGFIPYSNLAKQQMLDVKAVTLAQHGAVSEAVARELAQGALRNSQAHISVSITGIAGPSGGSPEKPVGTVWIGYATKDTVAADCYHFSGNRHAVRKQTILTTLETLISVAQSSTWINSY